MVHAVGSEAKEGASVGAELTSAAQRLPAVQRLPTAEQLPTDRGAALVRQQASMELDGGRMGCVHVKYGIGCE